MSTAAASGDGRWTKDKGPLQAQFHRHMVSPLATIILTIISYLDIFTLRMATAMFTETLKKVQY
jgi:hypothetical protein